ncbi:mucin-2 isoform X2 [Canis lupus dingo]|uniref:mucin-2 isoform X2 n=1 Tax=Canis lupus dingo TaxID=286419 RepID=UPI000DC6A8F8|nr:mucin-2 isoform X2 [Canis lupus dingo]
MPGATSARPRTTSPKRRVSPRRSPWTGRLRPRIRPQPQPESSTRCMATVRTCSRATHVTWQDEDEEADTYPSDLAVLREPEARPAEPASRTWGMSVIYTEVRCSRLADVPATRPKTRSRTHEAPPTLGTSRKPCTTDGTAPAPPTAASSAPQGASGDPNPSASP